MRIPKVFISIMIIVICVTSCKKDFIDPVNMDLSNSSRLLSDAAFAEGLLLNGYLGMPNSYSFDEAATDDAVNNVVGNQYSFMATGGWSSVFDPESIWDNAYRNIYYLNTFLGIVNNVAWALNDKLGPVEQRRQMFAKRFRGEALALRAWYNFELLKRHGGIATDGNPTGVVILRSSIDVGASLDLPRGSYDSCVNFILSDLDTAVTLLPNVYSDSSYANYQLVFGSENRNRVDGRFVKALRSRVSLYVASQSIYTNSNKWINAAKASADLLTAIGGVSGLSPTGGQFWLNLNDPEIIFRKDFTNINSWEVSNYPPSLFGQGNTDPSENLVDAFPMDNGYPITSGLSGYDPANPYNNRDPRLKNYILYNGNDLNGRVINTSVEDPTNGLNKTIFSTRTGYYLKKLLSPSLNISPSINGRSQHFYTIFRYTEMFLNYAEAANEAWGPKSDPIGYGFTPAEIIAAIRKRGGIEQPDNFLSSVSSSKDLMRELIRNERRIELCFEGFRFWDLRRWNLSLNESAKGMSISNGTNTLINVESRDYQSFMNYGPIPKTEIFKDNKLLQNNGW